jgi:toxin secretion/phage lysis holin
MTISAHKIDLIIGSITAIMSYIFGDFWGLFVFFFFLNVADYITGVIKARYTRTENSIKGARGIAKKVGYWIVLAIAFFIPSVFVTIGERVGLNLSFFEAIGWFTLATYIINEIRSILENLIMLEVPIPKVLTKGLEVLDKIIDKEGNKVVNKEHPEPADVAEDESKSDDDNDDSGESGTKELDTK